MYRCQCHTCEEDHLKGDLQSAQAIFNEHAGQQHKVVLRRIKPQHDGEPSSGGGTTTAGTAGPSDDGTEGHGVDD